MSELRTVLDYETRSCADLEAVGAIEYAKHKSTSIFCLGYKIDNNAVRLWVPEHGPMPADLWRAFKRGTLVAHNASFERAITRHTLTRYGCLTAEQRELLSSIPSSRWRCSAAKAAASSFPRNLGMAGMALGLATQKDKVGHDIIKKYCKPRKPTKNNPSRWWNDPSDIERIYDYCKVDVQAEFELDEALPDLSEYEQRVWELDQKINDRGVLIDILTVKIILGMIHDEVGRITKRVQNLSRGEIEKPTQTAKILAWVNARGAEMENLRAETIRDKLLEEDVNAKVRRMLIYRQGGSKTSTGKYVSMLTAVGIDHRARELLLYNGAIPTARWSGKRIQPQNFPRPTIKGFKSDEAIELIKTGGIWAIREKYGAANVMDVLVSSIRGMIIATPGHELFCSDFSSVEARIAFWVAFHQEGIDAFNNGAKLYEMMAAEAFDMEVDAVTKDSLERFVGKESILGCQYGMGWLKFMNQCHKKGMSKVTAEIAKKAVYTYRRVHHPVPTMWKNLEEAAIAAVMTPGSRHATNRVVFYVRGDYLNIKLPSGRRLRYYKPRIKQKQLRSGRMVPEIRYMGMNHHVWQECSIWGGIFANHIIQGIARDLMANAMLNIDAAGYKFMLSVHDEALAERKIGRGNLKKYTRHMTNLPAWADGCPITAESWKGMRYRK